MKTLSILAVILLLTIFPIGSYFVGQNAGYMKAHREVEESEDALRTAIDSLRDENQILGSTLSECEITLGRYEILYDRARQKLSEKEIQEVESNIE